MSDSFIAARQLYNRRKTLLEKADALFEQAPEDVQIICAAKESSAASARIDVAPSSPNQDDDGPQSE